MPRKAKRRDRLAALEREFFIVLAAELEDCAAGVKPLLFYSRDFNPYALPLHSLQSMATELVDRARTILRLRAQLGEPAEDCAAYIFLNEVRSNADATNPHRLGARRVAQKLLDELRRRGR